MKKSILTLSVLICSLAILIGAVIHTDVYQVDIEKSKVEWYAKKVSGKHNGTIRFSGGELRNDHGKITGSFEIEMSTIENVDIESKENRTKLENHLKSADFFEVEKFPKAKFVVTSVVPVDTVTDSGFTHKVSGMLTIKDKTNPIEFGTEMLMEGNLITCTGEMIIDRTEYDVRYGSKKFFKDIGDKMIYDDFTLKFTLVLAK